MCIWYEFDRSTHLDNEKSHSKILHPSYHLGFVYDCSFLFDTRPLLTRYTWTYLIHIVASRVRMASGSCCTSPNFCLFLYPCRRLCVFPASLFQHADPCRFYNRDRGVGHKMKGKYGADNDFHRDGVK